MAIFFSRYKVYSFVALERDYRIGMMRILVILIFREKFLLQNAKSSLSYMHTVSAFQSSGVTRIFRPMDKLLLYREKTMGKMGKIFIDRPKLFWLNKVLKQNDKMTSAQLYIYINTCSFFFLSFFLIKIVHLSFCCSYFFY